MKIIHAADLHLGSKINSKFNKKISEDVKNSLLASFNNLIDYAKANKVEIVLLSGDIFDSDHPTKKDKEYFYDTIRNCKDILFFYLKGNHDLSSYEEYDINNLKVFSDSLKTYNAENTGYQMNNITISGVEISKTNSESFYTDLNFDENKINILMLHGEVSLYKKEGAIILPKLKNQNIDYLALGHIHKNYCECLDNRGIYAYSGCLQGRGFDELDEKGFYLLDVNEKINQSFVKLSNRNFKIFTYDVSSCDSIREIYENILDITKNNTNDFVRVVLTGKMDSEDSNISQTLTNLLNDKFYYIEIDNKIKKSLEMPYTNEVSIRSEFINVLKNKEYSEEEKEDILTLGLNLIEDDK